MLHRVNSDPRRGGFTLAEVLIFSAIFTSIMIAFIGVFVAVTGAFSRQSGSAEVSGQSQFLLQQIQQRVERASLIEMGTDAPASMLKLRMAAAAEDPTYIYVTNGVAYIKKTDIGTEQPLTSKRVSVSSLTFTKRSNAPGRDSVNVSFMVTHKGSSVGEQFGKVVVRVSAATFDSNIIPSVAATQAIGVIGQGWKSINDVIYFSGGSVGIGTANPQSAFHVSDGQYVQLENNEPGAPPVTDCDVDSERGRLSIDTANNRLYICNGAARGWDYVTLSP